MPIMSNLMWRSRGFCSGSEQWGLHIVQFSNVCMELFSFGGITRLHPSALKQQPSSFQHFLGYLAALTISWRKKKKTNNAIGVSMVLACAENQRRLGKGLQVAGSNKPMRTDVKRLLVMVIRKPNALIHYEVPIVCQHQSMSSLLVNMSLKISVVEHGLSINIV